jgi:hypothetical protein
LQGKSGYPEKKARVGLAGNQGAKHTYAMDAEDLLQTMHRKEFRPVELHLVNGQTMLVPHPDYFLVFPNRKSALVFPDGVHFEILDLAAVVRAVPIASASPS